MITFKINGTNISNDVILNTFNYMHRTDDIFGSGSFQFESKTITENIPPYSILEIGDEVYCCSSEATYHYGRTSWVHTVAIIEATSLLSRFLVGSKAFSITGTNQYDYDKINILLKLMEDKYDVIFEGAPLTSQFSNKIEYVFTAGTTLFDALSEICKQYNKRVVVSSVDEYNGKQVIGISYVDLSNLATFNLDENLILRKTKIQNAETYCRYLETEATNVIDTNQPTLVKNLYPTANEIRLSEDTFVVKLPTPIYKVVSFKVKADGSINFSLLFPSKLSNELVVKTYGEWASLYPSLNKIFEQIFSNYYEWDYFKNLNFRALDFDLRPDYVDPNNANLDEWGYLDNAKKTFDYSNRILSKEQYDLIEDKEKPNYAYYTLGSNDIDGFSIYYRDDFWNSIVGKTNEPFLKDTIWTDELPTTEIDGIKIVSWFASGGSFAPNYLFDVEYYPISNPYLIDEKKDTPKNEKSYKPYALSYNKSGNFVDFDKLKKSLEIETQSMGKPELIIEYDTTNKAFGFPLFRKTFIEGQEWYIISSETTYRGTQQISTFNLVSNYNKIAEIVALNSQYNTLKNPLENIIERPLFFETNETFELVQGETFISVSSYFNDEAGIRIHLRPVIFKHNGEIYLYCSMLDQYSAGTNTVKIKENEFKVNDARYVDSNNEVQSLSLRIVRITDLTMAEAKHLPVYNGNNRNVLVEVENNRNIYKDAREKLTFTIKANHCIIN